MVRRRELWKYRSLCQCACCVKICRCGDVEELNEISVSVRVIYRVRVRGKGRVWVLCYVQ